MLQNGSRKHLFIATREKTNNEIKICFFLCSCWIDEKILFSFFSFSGRFSIFFGIWLQFWRFHSSCIQCVKQYWFQWNCYRWIHLIWAHCTGQWTKRSEHSGVFRFVNSIRKLNIVYLFTYSIRFQIAKKELSIQIDLTIEIKSWYYSHKYNYCATGVLNSCETQKPNDLESNTFILHLIGLCHRLCGELEFIMSSPNVLWKKIFF